MKQLFKNSFFSRSVFSLKSRLKLLYAKTRNRKTEKYKATAGKTFIFIFEVDIWKHICDMFEYRTYILFYLLLLRTFEDT